MHVIDLASARRWAGPLPSAAGALLLLSVASAATCPSASAQGLAAGLESPRPPRLALGDEPAPSIEAPAPRGLSTAAYISAAGLSALTAVGAGAFGAELSDRACEGPGSCPSLEVAFLTGSATFLVVLPTVLALVGDAIGDLREPGWIFLGVAVGAIPGIALGIAARETDGYTQLFLLAGAIAVGAAGIAAGATVAALHGRAPRRAPTDPHVEVGPGFLWGEF